ncbi:PIN domain-containing protein [Synergistaceae bacterium OttesenSCG-928-I11]|nr:PIN domain-containing protein [Synergistaceae bacterium OttesenSCG-928-I11]
MKKLRIYLDTSVISYLDQQDAPERMAETRQLWEQIKAGKYDVVISRVTVGEIEDCKEGKRNALAGFLKEIDCTIVPVDDKTIEIASRFLALGILREKSFDDCQHIAAAIISDCDAIVSWNFKHIVNHKTMMGVKAVAALEGYGDLLIYSPSPLLGGESDDTQ